MPAARPCSTSRWRGVRCGSAAFLLLGLAARERLWPPGLGTATPDICRAAVRLPDEYPGFLGVGGIGSIEPQPRSSPRGGTIQGGAGMGNSKQALAQAE